MSTRYGIACTALPASWNRATTSPILFLKMNRTIRITTWNRSSSFKLLWIYFQLTVMIVAIMAATRNAVTSSWDLAVLTPPMRDWVTFWAAES